MPGQFSGLTPNIISVTSATTTNADRFGICKFPNTATVTDVFIIFQTGCSTANSTTNLLVRILNGGTTGNVTTRALVKGGNAGGAWSAMTARQITTNYTFTANQWATVRYSETGTVAAGLWTVTLWAVDGNV